MTQTDDTLAIGVDLGGTKIEMALVDGGGQIVARARRATGPSGDAERIARELISYIGEEFLRHPKGRIAGLGIGVAGQVEPASGLVRYAPNLKWRNFPLRERLQNALAMPVRVMNDVQAATLGEWAHGAGRDARDLVCVFVGTGIGGGIVSGGRLLEGASGNAGELGHLTLELDGPQCSCGNHGCLEALASGWAIAGLAQRRARDDKVSAKELLNLAGGNVERITAETVSEAFGRGDALARELIAQVGRALGAGLSSIANAFNPALLILGGGVIEGVPELIKIAETEARLRALEAASAPLHIVKARLGSDAGAIGAATRILQAA